MHLSVVVPCYNEEESLTELHRRVKAACEDAGVGTYEIILVNDGSGDRTLEIMKELAAQDSHLVIVDLSRNFGHQLALSAGLSEARGAYIFVLDADLQDPPELLKPMLERAYSGMDVVYGQRKIRKGESVIRMAATKAFYRLLSFLSATRIPENVGDFRLMSRPVLDHLLKMPERQRFIRGMIAWIGFKQEAFLYERDPRYAGTTKYPFLKLLQFAIDAISSFSIRPLRVSLIFALAGVIIAVFLALYAFVSYFSDRAMVAGWASLATIIAFFSSLQLICIGVIGEYIGRIYIQAKGRPLFIVREIYKKD